MAIIEIELLTRRKLRALKHKNGWKSYDNTINKLIELAPKEITSPPIPSNELAPSKQFTNELDTK